MKIKNWQINLIVLFMEVEAVFTMSAQTLSGPALQAVEYTSICLCFVFALMFVTSKKYNFVIVLGLLFTLGGRCLFSVKYSAKTSPRYGVF